MGDRGVDEGRRATLRRVAALGAVGPFAGLAEDDSGIRETIAGYLATTPGAHFSKIRDDLDLATGETQHHLKRLERDGTVESHRDGDYRRYFPAREFDDFERTALGFLRRETPRGMVIALLRDGDATASDLAAAVDVSRPTISNHAADLDAAGLLSREDGYSLVRPERLLTLLVSYADSFDAATVRFAREADQFISVDA
ncbi:winged helix-turn-helix transcriptional regulator [Halococcus qingdaonensis]|uniref:winged helix-turn-helix transcriptional regulator n=1 Tax=Halococcus qingdaonensis TaxID=224402 RepID=UPI002115D58A|nr:ArsR family transcriptional regulator [Halococcus qingdaonensis]